MDYCPARQSGFALFFQFLRSAVQRTGMSRPLLLFQNQEADQPLPLSREAVNQRAEQILDDYGNSLLRLAYAYLHNMSDAEEVLQDTLIQLMKKMPVFENKRHEKAWLMRVAANFSKNRLAYNKVRSTDELSETLAASDQPDLSFVWEAVKALPVKYRAVIHLFYQEGYSTAQIAEILNQNEATVRSHLHRGRAKLKEILKEAYDFDGTVPADHGRD